MALLAFPWADRSRLEFGRSVPLLDAAAVRSRGDYRAPAGRGNEEIDKLHPAVISQISELVPHVGEQVPTATHAGVFRGSAAQPAPD